MKLYYHRAWKGFDGHFYYSSKEEEVRIRGSYYCTNTSTFKATEYLYSSGGASPYWMYSAEKSPENFLKKIHEHLAIDIEECAKKMAKLNNDLSELAKLQIPTELNQGNALNNTKGD